MSGYFGVYRGLVVDNQDPQGRLRVKVRVPSITGTDGNWAEPCVPPGWHNKNRDLVADHEGHGTHADPDGTLSHTHDHGAANPHRLVTQVPRPGIEGVWVMFEEGDVEHPVWIGTYKIGAN